MSKFNKVGFYTTSNGKKEFVLKFRLLDNGKGEFFEVKPGYGEAYKKELEKNGVNARGIKINPVREPKKFIDLVPKYYSGTYEGWSWLK